MACGAAAQSFLFARKPMSPIAVIDFETTGVSPGQGARATEVAIVLLERGQVVDRFQSLMKTGVWIPSFITQLTGITNAMVNAAPDAAQVMQDAARFVGDAPMVAHNASFDASVLCQACEVDGLETPDLEYVCTRDMAKELWPLSDYKLPTVMKAVGKVMVGHHDALADARAVVAVVDGMRRQLQHVGSLRELAGALDVQIKELRRARLRVR